MQLEKLPEIRLILDDQHLVMAAGATLRRDAGASLKQLLDGRRQNPAMAARRLPGAQQSGFGPQLHGAQRNPEAIGGLARRTDFPPGLQKAPLPATEPMAGMTASRGAECNVKLDARRAGEFR